MALVVLPLALLLASAAPNLPAVIAELKQQGVEFVTFSELAR